jgi:hypothetical protein
MVDFNDLKVSFKEAVTKDPATKERRTSKVIVVMAHGEGIVLLCEESIALDFVREAGCGASTDGFVCESAGIDIQSDVTDGVYIGEMRIVDGGPESWEMPDVRDYYAQIDKLRPIEKEEWKSHLAGEWPEGFAWSPGEARGESP